MTWNLVVAIMAIRVDFSWQPANLRGKGDER